MIKVNILVRLRVSEKDEPYPGAMPTTAANVVSRMDDVLGDSTKHDEIISWRIESVTLVQPKTAAIRQQITQLIEVCEGTANSVEASDAESLRQGYMAEGLQLALDIIDAAIKGS